MGRPGARPFVVFVAALAAAAFASAQPSAYPGVGRAATPKEIAAWDIDVRPDFKGLPAGSGSVAKGMEVWEAKCASCHGVFGESNEVFFPIVGGTTAEDVRSGRVATLREPGYPGRTTLMKLSTVSTLWDYINRAMPWTQPKSLTPDEVYGVTAYILNLGGIVPDDFVLSHRNIADVQRRLPNRNGTTTAHAMWPGRLPGTTSRPDVQGTACMSGCSVAPKVASMLPDHARNSHGNLAEQNRGVGAQHGTVTAGPAAVSKTTPAPAGGLALAERHACVACHALDQKLVGPSFREIARRHGERADAAAYLAAKVTSGGSGVWGNVPMPPQTLADGDAQAIARWLAAGAP